MKVLTMLLGSFCNNLVAPSEFAAGAPVFQMIILALVTGLACFAHVRAGEIASANQPGLSVQETFDLYVRAVQNSDLASLFTTVTDGEKFMFLTADGKLIDSRQGYYQFHEAWFKEKDWEMPVELLEVDEGKDRGHATAIFHYRQRLSDGTFYNLDSHFTLIFHKENGRWKVVADICTPIARYISEPHSEIKYDQKQLFLFDTFKNRRTVRKYQPTPVPEEHILKILDAARSAPTAGNQQPWKFLIIRDRSKLDRLKDEALAWYLEKYKRRVNPAEAEYQSTRQSLQELLADLLSAPVYVAVLVDSQTQYPAYAEYDGVLAAGYLMVAARALGYGTGFFTTFFPDAKMKPFLGIPDRYKLICFTPIGVPESWPEAPPKKELKDFILYESFSDE